MVSKVNKRGVLSQTKVALRKLGCSWGPNPPQRPSGIGADSMLAAARADHPGARCQAGRRR